jgi:sulfur-oxidizing protein SoxX
LIQSNSIGHARTALGCGALLATLANVPAWAADSALVPYRVENGQIRAPLTTEPGDAARGKAAVLSRDGGNCFLCHTVPEAGDTPLGNIGPPLAGVGRRLSAAQLRLRLVDSTRLNKATVMPAYYRIKGLRGVAPAYAGKPLLSAQQIEDVIAYLLTLRN